VLAIGRRGVRLNAFKRRRLPPITQLTMRTLILDDQEAIVSLLTRVCTAEGHDVVPFTSSTKALSYLAIEPIDLLITDLKMPGPDGVAVMREAQRLQPDIFTLIITGHAGKYPIAELLSSGTADVMFKPFHMNELRARLALAHRRKQLISSLHRTNQQLQVMSTEMIQGLQSELEEARNGRRRAGLPSRGGGSAAGNS
jgi:DNA-binding response OmpR family regulator